MDMALPRRRAKGIGWADSSGELRGASLLLNPLGVGPALPDGSERHPAMLTDDPSDATTLVRGQMRARAIEPTRDARPGGLVAGMPVPVQREALVPREMTRYFSGAQSTLSTSVVALASNT